MSGRKFTELNAGTVGANSIFAQAQAPATPGDPYTSTKVSATDVGNFVNGTQAYADIGNVTPLAAIAALQQGGASTANANIADEYDSSHTYNTGNRVIYEGVLYVCNDDNVTGAWDSTKWDSATIDEIISALTAADIPYSAGVSVADKLDSLSASVNMVNSYTAIYDRTKINQGNIYAYSIGKIFMITGYMRTTLGNISADTVIASISEITLAQEIFASSVGVDGTGLRLMVYTDGRLRIERQMPANEWFSFTMIGFLA